ncbi:uncharacterized protein LOC105220828 [Zeugodacus cucurbitae]|uniref:uncharacterized protein LOC105220828 n=1 Tax=Zeugodacus cucurbitae TaxID=28588 RepID=UPI0023D94F71|nr:uncharacterized protein LOC105220828 [Zeugodacus cucurbitae]
MQRRPLTTVHTALRHATEETEMARFTHANRKMNEPQQQTLKSQKQQQQFQQKCLQSSLSEMSNFQFRIVVMPQRLQMRLLLPPIACLATLSLVGLLFVAMPPVCQAVGYSYTRFSGPVTGPEQKIIVHDGLVGSGVGAGGGGGARVDFIAKPAYEFAYGVEDAQARLLQNRQETRDGDAVWGSYSVVDPDGNLRVVKYTADHENGFQAEVSSNGLGTTVHGHQPVSYTPLQNHAATPPPLRYFPFVVQHPVMENNDTVYYEDENDSDTEDYEEHKEHKGERGNTQEGELENEYEGKGDEDSEADEHDEHEEYDAEGHSLEEDEVDY